MRSGCSVTAALLTPELLCKIHLQESALPPRSGEKWAVLCSRQPWATGVLSFCFLLEPRGFWLSLNRRHIIPPARCPVPGRGSRGCAEPCPRVWGHGDNTLSCSLGPRGFSWHWPAAAPQLWLSQRKLWGKFRSGKRFFFLRGRAIKAPRKDTYIQ